jgi:hypothetical protein
MPSFLPACLLQTLGRCLRERLLGVLVNLTVSSCGCLWRGRGKQELGFCHGSDGTMP